MPLTTDIKEKYTCCPNCLAHLQNGRCSNCQNQFKQVLGILDLRWPKEVRSNPIEDSLIAALVESYSEFSFQTLISLRFQSSKLPEVIRGAYQQYAANPQSRSQQMLEMFQKRTAERFHCTGKEIALDLGCGVGASSFILAKQFELVIGVDSDLISLILAKKYLEEHGVTNVILVCAYAQKLPIASDAVSYAIAQNVLEHLFDVESALSELRRVLHDGGCFCGDSRNRYDLLFPEPHVKLRWVGFWPRRWQAWYVWQFRKTSYEHTQLLSLPELKKTASVIFGSSSIVTFPYSVAYNRNAKWDKGIQFIEKIPFFRWFVLLFFPSHLLIAQANSKQL